MGYLVVTGPAAVMLGLPGTESADEFVGTTPSPTPTTVTSGVPTMRPDLEVTDVSPGLEGFLAIFVVAIVAIFLMLSMTKKLRKINHDAGADTQASADFMDPVRPSAGDMREDATGPTSTEA